MKVCVRMAALAVGLAMFAGVGTTALADPGGGDHGAVTIEQLNDIVPGGAEGIEFGPGDDRGPQLPDRSPNLALAQAPTLETINDIQALAGSVQASVPVATKEEKQHALLVYGLSLDPEAPGWMELPDDQFLGAVAIALQKGEVDRWPVTLAELRTVGEISDAEARKAAAAGFIRKVDDYVRSDQKAYQDKLAAIKKEADARIGLLTLIFGDQADRSWLKYARPTFVLFVAERSAPYYVKTKEAIRAAGKKDDAGWLTFLEVDGPAVVLEDQLAHEKEAGEKQARQLKKVVLLQHCAVGGEKVEAETDDIAFLKHLIDSCSRNSDAHALLIAEAKTAIQGSQTVIDAFISATGEEAHKKDVELVKVRLREEAIRQLKIRMADWKAQGFHPRALEAAESAMTAGGSQLEQFLARFATGGATDELMQQSVRAGKSPFRHARVGHNSTVGNDPFQGDFNAQETSRAWIIGQPLFPAGNQCFSLEVPTALVSGNSQPGDGRVLVVGAGRKVELVSLTSDPDLRKRATWCAKANGDNYTIESAAGGVLRHYGMALYAAIRGGSAEFDNASGFDDSTVWQFDQPRPTVVTSIGGRLVNDSSLTSTGPETIDGKRVKRPTNRGMLVGPWNGRATIIPDSLIAAVDQVGGIETVKPTSDMVDLSGDGGWQGFAAETGKWVWTQKTPKFVSLSDPAWNVIATNEHARNTLQGLRKSDQLRAWMHVLQGPAGSVEWDTTVMYYNFIKTVPQYGEMYCYAQKATRFADGQYQSNVYTMCYFDRDTDRWYFWLNDAGAVADHRRIFDWDMVAALNAAGFMYYGVPASDVKYYTSSNGGRQSKTVEFGGARYIMWRADFGAVPMYGGIGGVYTRIGRDRSVIGFPTKNTVYGAAGEVTQYFERGRIRYQNGQSAVYDTAGNVLYSEGG